MVKLQFLVIPFSDYEATADTYLKLGEIDKALENITIAFMLNPHNSNMIRSLNEILNLSNHYLRGNRTRFPYEVEKQNEQECKLTFDENNGLNWLVKTMKGYPNYGHLVLSGKGATRGPITESILASGL